MKKEISTFKVQIDKYESDANKNECSSMRNNIRLVGIPEPLEGRHDDCIQIAVNIIRTHFDIESRDERAHRDGKKVEDRLRHVLMKLLSYRDKVNLMRKHRKALKDKNFFIMDDHTPVDLREKQKRSKNVRDL